MDFYSVIICGARWYAVTRKHLFLYRRLIWNFFRLENEHLNNCGQFRAVRDISIAPIHVYSQAALEHLMDRENGSKHPRRVRGGGRKNKISLKEPSKHWILINLLRDWRGWKVIPGNVPGRELSNTIIGEWDHRYFPKCDKLSETKPQINVLYTWNGGEGAQNIELEAQFAPNFGTILCRKRRRHDSLASKLVFFFF